MRTFAVVAGGGTAGHVAPAVAVAKALVDRGHDAGSVHFVGSRRGVEARLVPDAGFSVTLLPGRGIARRLTGANVGAVLGLLAALVQGVVLVARRRPAVVLSVGGYASVPCAVAAVACRVPLVLHEQNAVPGLANRLVGRFARAAAVSFPGTPLPRAELTGNPVREGLGSVDRAGARAALGLPAEGLVVAAFGGSLGARSINAAVARLADAWSGRDDVVVYHVVGRRDWAGQAGTERYRPVEYEDRMPLLLAAADVAVCRAGGSTVAELAVAGVPAVLVPLPGAPGDHQTANAAALVDAGAAVLVPDPELTAERLAAELEPLLAAPARLAAMAAAARQVGIPDAADRVAALVERHARRGHGDPAGGPA